MKKKIFISIISILLFCLPYLFGQLNGTVTVPGTYSTLTAAITALNSSGVNGPLTISYTGGNQGGYTAQTIISTGVIGLTANLNAGTIVSGTGNLVFTISGTPNTSGIAVFAVSVGGQSCSFTMEVSTQYAPGSVFCAAGATEIVDIISPNTGKIWMDRNLGASQAATSSTDSSSYGDLYQWGRRADGHQCRRSPLASALSSGQPTHGSFIIAPNSPFDWGGGGGWDGLKGSNNPCPKGYRVPTKTELEWEVLCCGPSSGTIAANTLFKWPMPGYRANDGSLYGAGTIARYWTSSFSGSGAECMQIQSYAQASIANRADGSSVRCLKDYELGSVNTLACGSAFTSGTIRAGTSTSNVSVTISYTGGNGGSYGVQSIASTGITGLTANLATGIFANGEGNLVYTISGSAATSGIATFRIDVGGQICSFTVIVTEHLLYPAGSVFCTSSATAIVDVTNPSTGKIWMDRNLGASQAATSSTDAASYGDLYQWGRRSDGHQCRNSTYTNTLSSSDQPAHGSYIVAQNSPYDWRSPQNDNLWQGANGLNNPCPSGYRLPTQTELDVERLSWNYQDSYGAFASPLKLPLAGFRAFYNFGALNQVGFYGTYWSSTVNNEPEVKLLWLGPGTAYISSGSRT
ncbi:MAG: hypothetical protein ACOYOA_14070 [Saprospiraceae bacterium]